MDQRINVIIFTILSLSCLIQASVEDVEKDMSHGGHVLKEHGVGGKDHENGGYEGHKGGGSSKGYSRGFSYGTGHDTADSVSFGDEGYNGKRYGDKEYRGYGLGGLGAYGGLGFRGYRPPFIFFG